MVNSSSNEIGESFNSNFGRQKNEMANCGDDDEMADYKPSHQDLHNLKNFMFCSPGMKYYDDLSYDLDVIWRHNVMS